MSGSVAGATIFVWKAWLTGMQRRPCTPASVERLERRLDRGGRAADDRLAVAVEVRDDDVAVDPLQGPLDLGERREDGGHLAVVGDGDARHLAAARADRLEGVVERHDAGGDERAVLAEAVPHHHVGHDAVGAEEAREREVGREHGRLGDLGLLQLLLGLGHGAGVLAVDEDVLAERPARASASMFRSASANVSATIGSSSRRARAAC